MIALDYLDYGGVYHTQVSGDIIWKILDKKNLNTICNILDKYNLLHFDNFWKFSYNCPFYISLIYKLLMSLFSHLQKPA